MNISTLERNRVVLVAPCEGTVSFAPPAALTGELEVYRDGEVIVVISSSTLIEEVAAPFDCFVLHQSVEDGDRVTADAPLMILRGV